MIVDPRPVPFMKTDLFIEIGMQDWQAKLAFKVDMKGLRADIVLRNAYPLFTGKDGSISNQICP